MGMFREFKDFVSRGNVIDLAVGVIMGAAFGRVVDSLVKDVMMPPIGYVMGGVDFSSLRFSLPQITIPDPTDATKAGTVLAPVTINYGAFLNTIISFTIVSICVFMLVKAINSLRRPAPNAPPEPPADIKLLTEIRDLLKNRTSS